MGFERQASMDGRAVSGAAGEKEGFGLMILMIGAMQSGEMRDNSFVQHRGAHWSRPRISVRDAIHPIQNPKHDVMVGGCEFFLIFFLSFSKSVPGFFWARAPAHASHCSRSVHR